MYELIRRVRCECGAGHAWASWRDLSAHSAEQRLDNPFAIRISLAVFRHAPIELRQRLFKRDGRSALSFGFLGGAHILSHFKLLKETFVFVQWQKDSNLFATRIHHKLWMKIYHVSIPFQSMPFNIAANGFISYHFLRSFSKNRPQRYHNRARVSTNSIKKTSRKRGLALKSKNQINLLLVSIPF